MGKRIDPRLLERIREKLNLAQAATYNRIAKRAREEKLPLDLAAISLASDLNINISRFATPEQLAELRGARRHAPTAAANNGDASRPPATNRPRAAERNQSRAKKRRGNKVFVVHGRNEKIRKAMFAFLRAAGVQPIEWSKALQMTGKASPYIGEVLQTAFSKAQAVVVLLTPDDEARLKREFQAPSDPAYEKRLTGQARPNVLFEAGMAFGTHPEQTVLVEVGTLRPFSDTYGRHVVHLSNDGKKRQELMIKLQNAGCEVDFVGTDWQNDGDFTL